MGGAGPAVRRAAGGPPAATLAARECALPPSRGAAPSPPPEPPGLPASRGRYEQSAVNAVTPIEPARGPADDLVPVSGHPQFQPGVTRILLRVGHTQDQCGLPSAPMRTRSRASMPSPDSGAGWCSSSTREGPYLRARPPQIRPADSVTEMRPPVSVTTARYPGAAVAVAQTRRCPAPSRARPRAGYCQNGSSTSSSPSGGRSAAEAGVSPSISDGRTRPPAWYIQPPADEACERSVLDPSPPGLVLLLCWPQQPRPAAAACAPDPACLPVARRPAAGHPLGQPPIQLPCGQGRE